MDTLTYETIKAAQDKDLAATAEVIKATESRITHIAYRLGASADQREEFAQVGRIAVWEALPRWTGDNVDGFYAFIHKTVEGKIKDASRVERAQGATGADRDALWIFGACLKEVKGDADAAEHLCATLPPKGRRLSPERAQAARLAWMGTVSLDGPTSDGNSTALAEMIATDYGVPDDLVEPSDRMSDEKRRKLAIVNAVIESMGAKQAYALRTRWGIGTPEFGTGAEADAEVADAIGVAPSQVGSIRNKAHRSFASRYGKITGLVPCDCTKCGKYRAERGVSV
ncbi:sigma factor [Streptomyces sp. NPDC048142]|uniref:sigma factor n=1 Tax=Streptomyces sp. NPDC048142 TaxID=3365501 RepID=UPI003715C99F